MEPLTDDQKKDVSERIDGFTKDYNELSAKWQVAHATQPLYLSQGDGRYSTVVLTEAIDLKYRPVPSPLKP